MFPQLPSDYVFDSRLSDAVLLGKDTEGIALSVSKAYRPDLFFGEFDPWVIRPNRGVASTLPIHVPDVVELSSKEQVVRVDASRVVALVKNAHANWYPSDMKGV
jgi:hypothetical protein